jgi:hypothetical protein
MRYSFAILSAILAAGASGAPLSQTEADEYTRYELLVPETAQFRILYEVTATTAGATVFYNPIRKGSAVSNEAVYDRLTGQRLPFEIVPGPKAKAEGYAEAENDTSYLRVRLSRPVTLGGGVRLLIDKTYKDPASYFVKDGTIVFSRALGVRRNAIVLPPGYELVGCNTPAQVLSESDGRILVTFMNPLPVEVPLLVRARKLR